MRWDEWRMDGMNSTGNGWGQCSYISSNVQQMCIERKNVIIWADLILIPRTKGHLRYLPLWRTDRMSPFMQGDGAKMGSPLCLVLFPAQTRIEPMATTWRPQPSVHRGRLQYFLMKLLHTSVKNWNGAFCYWGITSIWLSFHFHGYNL